MNRINRQLLTVACLFLLTALSCRREVTQNPGPDPDPGNLSRMFHFSINALPGSATPRQHLYALVSITNKDGQAVITDKKLTLTYQQKYKTAALELPLGEYKLSKLLIFDNDNVIEYAAPLTGSARANEVNVPLLMAFTLTKTGSEGVPVQVARVNNGDTPGDFGYIDGTFIPKSDNPQTLKIKIRTALTIGNVVYDSIPSSLLMTTWDARNVPRSVMVTLRPGVNELYLDPSASRYYFKVNRWNITDEMTLNAGEVEEGKLYTMGGSRAARKLKALNTAVLVNGTYLADNKSDYEYGANGKVSKILYYKKDPNHVTQLDFTETISYNTQQKASIIKRLNGDGSLRSEDVMVYRQDGWLEKITRTEPEGITTASMAYLPLEGHAGLTNYYKGEVFYQFTQNYYTQNYHAQFHGGLIVTDELTTSHGDLVTGWYEYDANINPFVHLELPDLYFVNSWKHNRVTTARQYNGRYTQAIPFETVYTYDAEGYPTQVIIKYKSYFTGEFLFQTKSVFYYY